jgi:glycosyltransferase 2 family protein
VLTLPQVLLWLAINLLIIALAIWRWQLLSAMLGTTIGFARLLLLRQAGQTVSFLTPGPQFGGEPLQIYWLYSHYAVPLHKAVLALGLDRFLELGINLLLLLLGVLLLVAQGTGFAQWQVIAADLLLVLVLLLLLAGMLLHPPRWLDNRFERLARSWFRHPRLRQLGSHWSELVADLQLAVKASRWALLGALLLSLAAWAVLLTELALLLAFLAVDITLPGFVLIVVALRLALLLPLPGGIGTVEAAVLWSFQLLALPLSAAIGLIALMRLRDVIILLTGLLCLNRIRFHSLLQRSLRTPGDTPPSR